MPTSPLSFGLSLPNRAVLFGLSAETLLKTAEAAEASGAFDSVWVGDNLLFTPRLESVVLLSAIAARTSRVKLGTICLASFPLRDPLLFAIQWASLDLLSGGRTILAVCIGKSAKDGPTAAAELAAFRIPSAERAGRLEEGIELLRRFWGPEPVTYAGRFFSYDNVEVLPKPAQVRPPIVIAGLATVKMAPAVEERLLRRTARLSDGWQTTGGTPPNIFGDRWDKIRQYAAEAGRADQVTESQLHMMVNIDDDVERAKRVSAEFLNHYYGESAAAQRLERHLAYGPPAVVIEKIRSYVEVGLTTPVLRFTSPDQLGQLERCINEVLPAFR